MDSLSTLEVNFIIYLQSCLDCLPGFMRNYENWSSTGKIADHWLSTSPSPPQLDERTNEFSQIDHVSEACAL